MRWTELVGPERGTSGRAASDVTAAMGRQLLDGLTEVWEARWTCDAWRCAGR
jgi:hypothetical protein